MTLLTAGALTDPRLPATASNVCTTDARWPSGLERWTGDRTVRGSNPTAENFSLRNFGNSVYPALPVYFGGDTKSRRSLLSGVYARGSKIPHQSALECVTVVDSTAHSKTPPEVRPCGGKRCPALNKKKKAGWRRPGAPPQTKILATPVSWAPCGARRTC